MTVKVMCTGGGWEASRKLPGGGGFQGGVLGQKPSNSAPWGLGLGQSAEAGEGLPGLLGTSWVPISNILMRIPHTGGYLLAF